MGSRDPSENDISDGDWQFVRALCESAEKDISAVVRGVVRNIREDLPTYAVVPWPDHEAMVREHVRRLLAGLAARRLPAEADADHGRAMGRRRAQQGVAVEEVLSAYHLGYRDVWNTLLCRAHSEDPQQAARLLGLVNLVWAWLRVITIAVADGHAETTRAREENRIGVGHEFLDALYAGRITAESTELLAHALGFDPQGDFQVVCCSAEPWPTSNLDLLRRRLRAEPGTSSAIIRGSVLVIVFQRTSAERILDLLSCDSSPVAGVGLVRPGLAGAAAAVVDAERSLAVAQRNGGGIVDFGSEWLAATLLPHMDRLRPLTDTTAAVEQPHLCDAVRAYADNGFSVTASARALHVHPNTVKYRLDRWKEHTGWDPRTLDGLQRSLLGIAFSSVPDAGRQ